MDNSQNLDSKASETRKGKLNKSHAQGFIAGILAMALISVAVMVLFNTGFFTKTDDASNLGAKNPGGSSLGGVQVLQSVQKVTKDTFTQEVLKAPGQTVVFFNNYTSSEDLLDNILENISINWGDDIKMFDATYAMTEFIESLGIDTYKIPLFVVFENGKILGVKPLVIEENSISQWLTTFKQPHIYRAFPSSAYNSVGTERDNFFISELCLLPKDTDLPGFIKCTDNKTLSVSENTTLYALIQNKFGGDKTNFMLPNLQSQIPASGLTYYLCKKGEFPIRDSDMNRNAIVSGNIKYLEFPIKELNQSSYIGEIILAKNVVDKDYENIMILCDGRSVNVNTYPALNSIFGNKFGGDGVKTIKLPDLSNVPSPIEGAKYYMLLRYLYPSS